MPRGDNHPPRMVTASLNTEKLDGKPCEWCGEIPESRLDRIDCDEGAKGVRLVTYHKYCWLEACEYYENRLDRERE